MPTGNPQILSDGGFAAGSYDVNIGGFIYTVDTSDQDIPVSQADAYRANGTPKGGAFAMGKQKISVKVNAIQGIPRPRQLVPFQFNFDGTDDFWWIVTNLKISAANNGAVIRTYSADLVQLMNAPAAT